LLATHWRDQIAWEALHVFWGDERYVAHDDMRSNYRMAREALLDHVPCRRDQVHPMPTDLADPDAAARVYETTLGRYFAAGPPRFDLLLLGSAKTATRRRCSRDHRRLRSAPVGRWPSRRRRNHRCD
jgi:6-phosphogluconolactonase